MKTTSTNQLRKMWLVVCFVLLSLAGFSQNHVTFTLQGCSSTTNSVSYDLYLTNDGTSQVKLGGCSFGVNYSATILNGGTPTASAYVFVAGSKDPILSQPGFTTNAYTVSHTLTTHHLRITESPVVEGSAPTLPPGVPVKVGRFTFTNTTAWTANSNPAFALQMASGGGLTQCIATSYVDGNTVSQPISASTGTASGVVACAIQLNGCNLTAALTGNTPPVCLGGSNGSAQITLSGSGFSASGTYSLDGGVGVAFSGTTINIPGLSVGPHNVIVTAGCVSNTVNWTTSPGASSDDNNICTADACDPITGVSHTNVPTDDGNPCTADGCTNPSGVFHTNLTNTGGGTSDGLACTSDDCNNGVSVNNPISTNDNNPCTTDGCVEPTGVFHTNLTNTGGGSDDGLACTSDDCNNGVVVHNALPTDDNNPCTADGCTEPTGVFHTNLTNTGGGTSDGLACTSDDCNNGVTVHNALPTDDNNPCTADGCAEPTGVFHNNLTNIGGGSSDGLACTSDDCNNGVVVHNALPTNDNNPCTADGCTEPTGVFHNNLTNIGGGANDGLACTSDDCNNGVTVHNALPTNDNNPCTADGCTEPTGVFHTNLTNTGGGTSDGLVCTQDNCAAGNTVHPSVNTNDGNPCTADGCVEPTGVFHTSNPVLVTATPNAPIQCFGYSTCVNVSATGGSGSYAPGSTGLLCGYTAGDYTFTVTDNAGCSGTSGNVHLTEPDKIEGATSTTNSSCGGSTGTASVTPSGGSGTYTGYSWNSVPVQTTQTAIGLAAGTYTVTITDNSGCTGTATAVVVGVGAAPAQPSAIAGPAGACKGQVGIVYTVANVPGMTYAWTLPIGASGSSTTNSITVNYSLTYGGGFICVTATNACGTSSASCIPVPVITGRPAFPAQPAGPSLSVCGPTTVTYSIPPAANATSYVWTVTGTGFTLAAGQGSTTISVNVAAGFNSGQVRVYAVSCSGISGENSLFVYGAITSMPQQASFPNIGVCGGSTVQYCVSPFNGATSITWSGPAGSLINGLPTPQTLPGNTYCVNITFPVGFVSGNVSVYGSSGCGAGPVRVVAVRSTPLQPATLTGTASNLCGQSGVVYTVSAVAGATSYSWTVPAGATMASPNNTASLTMTVNYGAGFTNTGSVCVTAVNACGGGTARCLTVSARPDQPGAIAGSSSVCKSTAAGNYSVGPVAGVTYTWSITGGATVVGAGANATVNFTTATSNFATLTVTASNACGGAAAPRTLPISVNLLCRTANEAAIASEMNAYPNPTSGKLNVTFNASMKEKYTLKVVDLIGNVMMSQPSTAQAGANIQEIDLSSYAKGMYLLSIEREGAEIQTMRVVVQ